MGSGLRARGHLARLTLALALLLAACTGGGGVETTLTTAGTTVPASTTAATTTTGAATTSTTAPLGTPRGGEVVVGDDEEPPTLNPFAVGGGALTVAEISRAWTCGTQQLDGATLELVPDVVMQLPTIANGGLTINADGTETVRYRIREEAVWEDGTPVSGYDYEFTYQTIMNPDHAINRLIYADIVPDSVTAGAKSFEFTLARPSLGVENLFGVLLPRHQMEGNAEEFLTLYNDTGWKSCGPFRIESWQKGEAVRLVRNENYWKVDPETQEPLPYLDRLTFRFFPDTAALLQAFADRTVDVMAPSETEAEAIATLRGLEASGAEVQVAPGPIWEHLGFQFGANAAARNGASYNTHLNFRKAVAHAVDRQLIVDEIFGGEVGPLSSYVDAFRPAWSAGAWEQYDYDPAKAREYLAALCAEEGVDCEAVPPKVIFTATLNSPARVELSQLLIPMFEEVGLAYEAELEDSLLFFGETLERGNWDVGEWSWVGQPGVAELVAWHMMLDPDGPPPSGMNYYRWGTPEVSGADDPGLNQPAGFSDEASARFAELWDLMTTTVDVAEIQGYVAEAEALLADQVVLLPLYQRPDVGAAWADVVGGYRHTPLYLSDPVTGGDTWNVGLWYRKDL